MANLLTNAGFLDGVTGWSASSALTRSVDETTRGSAGRAVLTATGTSTSANQTLALETASAARPVVAGMASVEVRANVLAIVDGGFVDPVVAVQWRNTGGSLVRTDALPVRAAQSVAHGEARLGVRNTFRSVVARLDVPAGAATASLRVTTTAATSGTPVVLGLLKPMIAAAIPARTEPLTWTPGRHTDPDLDLPAWPQALRGFDVGPDGEPLPATTEFQGAAPGRPASRRIGLSPARRFEGTVRCSPFERALLDAFWSDVPGDFWLVEPGSDRLCVARWSAEGQPRMTEDRGEVWTVAVGLWLETA